MPSPRKYSVIRDPALRQLACRLLREYRRGGSARQNENLKHVRRMIALLQGHFEELRRLGCHLEALVIGILVSDVGKESHLIAKYLPEYRGVRFRAFMDHARISLRESNRIRLECGVSNRTWRRVVRSVIGHDGPSIDGSWWKEHYERELERPYPRLRSVDGLIHCYLDRFDQGGIYRGRSGELNGGLRKISYDMLAGEGRSDRFAEVIRLLFGSTREGTYTQLEHLDRHEAPRFLGAHPLPEFLIRHRGDFALADALWESMEFRPEAPDTVWIRSDSGTRVPVTRLDDFWRTLSRVTPSDRNPASSRSARAG